ncbi:glycerol-3-phosphate 1-O-acyltransferase PlsY [Zhaonella formicivorans]|uniref:glycerol-3-phosphate 1-O-acyltransferase PlsY n=1 Tax=Zhaonella formicivorans TaxID=2528593 RepID=UPI0010E7FC42|nr:glycerol-3-phosphate 1-O-acyltransferase PlsY [Zhaonella formicivorans]
MRIVGTLFLAYLLGSIPFALIAGKAVSGKDIRNYGSGNLGGTNAFRVLGWKAGLAVIGADILKGALATYIGLWGGNEVLGMLAGLAAALGHCYPLFAGFRGGKGVATGAGVFLVLAPKVIILSALVFGITLAVFRYVSLASIAGAITVAVLTWAFQMHIILIIASWCLVAFVIYRHRSNIQRLFKGTENRVGVRKKH